MYTYYRSGTTGLRPIPFVLEYPIVASALHTDMYTFRNTAKFIFWVCMSSSYKFRDFRVYLNQEIILESHIPLISRTKIGNTRFRRMVKIIYFLCCLCHTV